MRELSEETERLLEVMTAQLAEVGDAWTAHDIMLHFRRRLVEGPPGEG